MTPHMLAYYQRELSYMQEMATEFARKHPHVAAHLGMQGTDTTDPYVERLIEAFCFMSARTQMKMDAEFPRFTQRLLEVMSPHYLRPTPAISVAQVHPDNHQGDWDNGYVLPRDTRMDGKANTQTRTTCQFRSCQDVTLWPIAIEDVTLTDIPQGIQGLQYDRAASVLRLRLRRTDGRGWSQLSGLDDLPIYLCGDDPLASRLHELIHRHTIATQMFQAGQSRPVHTVRDNAILQPGLDQASSILPASWQSLHGNNLLQAYFSCPQAFYFFTLTGLGQAARHVNTTDMDVEIVLADAAHQLRPYVDRQQFALYCTPVINLFPAQTDQMVNLLAQPEFHFVPDRARPQELEVFSVEEITAQVGGTSRQQVFRPLLHTNEQDKGNHGYYFSVRRENPLPTTTDHGLHAMYAGSEAFISLVDQHHAPCQLDIRHLRIKALLTNRHLPCSMNINGHDDLLLTESAPVRAIGLCHAPSTPRPPFAEQQHPWRLIQQLQLHARPLTHASPEANARQLREQLQLMTTDDASRQLVHAIAGLHVTLQVCKLRHAGPLAYGRGMHCTLTIDEDTLSGRSPYVPGLLIAHWLSRHASINSSVQLTLHSTQRGTLCTWSPLQGHRGIR